MLKHHIAARGVRTWLAAGLVALLGLAVWGRYSVTIFFELKYYLEYQNYFSSLTVIGLLGTVILLGQVSQSRCTQLTSGAVLSYWRVQLPADIFFLLCCAFGAALVAVPPGGGSGATHFGPDTWPLISLSLSLGATFLAVAWFVGVQRAAAILFILALLLSMPTNFPLAYNWMFNKSLMSANLVIASAAGCLTLLLKTRVGSQVLRQHLTTRAER